MKNDCPFRIPLDRIIDSNEMSSVIRNDFLISPRLSLIIPKRQVGSFSGISQEERKSPLKLFDNAKKVTDQEFKPDGFNIGINNEAIACKTVPNPQPHFIPRFKGN